MVTRAELDDLHDRLYVLEAAVEDVERDLASATTIAEHREAIAWLLDAARPCCETGSGTPLQLESCSTQRRESPFCQVNRRTPRTGDG